MSSVYPNYRALGTGEKQCYSVEIPDIIGILNEGWTTMKALLTLIVPLAISFYFTDIESESGFRSLFLPLVDLVLLCALSLWVAGRTGWQTVSSRSGGGFFGGFFDGGDGGGGCD